MKAILEVKNVSKRFGGLRAVKDVSFAMLHGEILFVIGPKRVPAPPSMAMIAICTEISIVSTLSGTMNWKALP